MKYMKLGSKPDGFHSDAGGVDRYVVSDLPADITIHVGNVRFHLHKFPLLSKSWRLQKLALQADEEGTDDIFLYDFPGGNEMFEICAKFCYGMVVTLNAHSVAAARCAADYLEMTEDMEKGNLIFKIEVFLNSSVLRSWKDSIIALQTCKNLMPWADDTGIANRCVVSIASKATTHPSKVETGKNVHGVPKDWWVEDLCELNCDQYMRVMIEIQSRSRLTAHAIEEALKSYAVRWLPESFDMISQENRDESHRHVVETIISLLPSDREPGCSCKFLLKLLKVAIAMGAEDKLKEDLISMIGVQMDRASAKDLLIPVHSPEQTTTYDVELVHALVMRFMMNNAICRDRIFFGDLESNIEGLGCERGPLIRLGRLVDGYLAEIAYDQNLLVSTFVELAMSVPEAARTTHDALYTAIDIFLKEHKCLTKADKKWICSLIDVKKMSKEACIHAAQNDLLPLRVIVQVLFFEQLRSFTGSPQTDEKGWQQQASYEPSSTVKQKLGDDCGGGGMTQSARNSVANRSSRMASSSRSRRVFDRLWNSSREMAKHSKSPETSGSQSPRSTVRPAEAKSASSSSRYWRFSVS